MLQTRVARAARSVLASVLLVGAAMGSVASAADRGGLATNCAPLDAGLGPTAATGPLRSTSPVDLRPTWSVVLGVPSTDCSVTDLQSWGTTLVGLHDRWLWRSADGQGWELLPLPGGPGVTGRRLLATGIP